MKLSKSLDIGNKLQTKHLLLITPGFPKAEDDFNCIPPLQEFLISFNSRFPDINFTVISLHYPYQNKKYHWNGILIISLGGKNGRIKKPLLWYNVIRKAKKINMINRVDIIHSLWLGECAILGNILSKKFNCPHICTLMGQDVKASNRYLRLSTNEKIRIVALSQNQSNQFFQLTNRKPNEIIHWGIDDQNFKDTNRDLDLLAVGSLIPLKNYSLFIRLINEIKRTKPNVKCKLVGEGPELTRLKILANETGITDNIEFTGLLNRPEIFKLMQRSKIFVHPSKFEGFGFVFAEALVNGMNIISFNVGCAQQHPKWFIAKDESEFKKIMERLLYAELEFNPVNIFPMRETINKYASLYGID
jgi:glycosyltransferase involved in cell wall biosynthesis